MTHPKAKRTRDGWVVGWGRVGCCYKRDDPPSWRWPRAEWHHEDGARGVLIDWRLTGLAVMILDPVVYVDLAPPGAVDG